MNYAVIDKNGIVQNIIIYDGVSPYNPGAGLTLVQSDTAGIGDTYDGVNFTKQVEE